MGEVLQKNFSKESATFECTDIFVDLDKYILECEDILDKVKVGIEMNEKRKKVLQQSNEKYKANLENERDKRDI